MLKSLHLKNVGPAPEMTLELGSRMNLITGDNGLGKSFLLDVMWWALTRRWPQELNSRLTSGYAARPTDVKKSATIEFAVKSKSTNVKYVSTYVPRDEAWSGKSGRPLNPGLVIYAHADGGFSVWDPARNYWKKRGNIDVQERLPGYVLSPKEVWDGLKLESEGKSTFICNGLLADWAGWIRERGPNAKNMEAVLGLLSPIKDQLRVGPLTRISTNDSRDIPSIRTAYSSEIPVLFASSGVRRVLGLAYMLLWSWHEHHLAARRLGEKTTKQVVLLFDEIESHLHPRAQRSILRALLKLVTLMHRQATVQLIAATHSPLVMASAEPLFEAKQDAWFDLDLEGAAVILRKRPFVARGEVANWLTSEAFDFTEARSEEAETAIGKAKALLRSEASNWAHIHVVDQSLRAAALSEIDPFWVRWSHFVDSHRPKTAKKPAP
jgi:predicted ATPase